MTNPDIKAIRARLEAATDGPMVVVPDTAGAAHKVYYEIESGGACIAEVWRPANADLFANAPTDLAACVGWIEEAAEALSRGPRYHAALSGCACGCVVCRTHLALIARLETNQ